MAQRTRLVTALSAVVALGCIAPSYGQQQEKRFGFDQVQKSGSQSMPGEQPKSGSGVSYVSGGVGDDSQDRMAGMSREYNLKLMFTLNEGNYLAGVNVAVTDSRGNQVINDVSNGPFFFAKLPAGQYTVSATHEGKTQTRRVNVGKGMQTAHLRWASNANDFPGPRDGSPRTSDKVIASDSLNVR